MDLGTKYITEAIICARRGQRMEACDNYRLGISLLRKTANSLPAGDAKRGAYEHRLCEYENHMKQLKDEINLHTGRVLKLISIKDNEVGHNYDSLFGSFLNSDTKELLLEEPYLIENYHYHNLVHFLELVVEKCKNLSFLQIVTKPPEKPHLVGIKNDLSSNYNIKCSIQYVETLHDRRIVLSNGYYIKIGRGLHFFKAVSPQFSIGLSEYKFRKCLQTEVEICQLN